MSAFVHKASPATLREAPPTQAPKNGKFDTAPAVAPTPAGRTAPIPAEWTYAKPSALEEREPSDQASDPGAVPQESVSLADTKSPLGDKYVPNAIVIKSIPFEYETEESFLAWMESVGIPRPKAFNYHKKTANGRWKGLAFANFTNHTDTAIAQAGLNGYVLKSRTLACEFKLKQTEEEQVARQQAQAQYRMMSAGYQPRLNDPSNPRFQAFLASHRLQPALNRSTSTPAVSNVHQNGGVAPGLGNGTYDPSRAFRPTTLDRTMTSPNTLSDLTQVLTLSDPAASEIQSKIAAFKMDPTQTHLSFPSTFTPQQRSLVHVLARAEGLEHGSVGEGADRYVVVSRTPIKEATGSTASHNTPHRGLSRYHSHSNISTLYASQDIPGMGYGSALDVPHTTTWKSASPGPRRTLRSQVSTPDFGSHRLNRQPSGNLGEYQTISAGRRGTNPAVSSLFPGADLGVVGEGGATTPGGTVYRQPHAPPSGPGGFMRRSSTAQRVGGPGGVHKELESAN